MKLSFSTLACVDWTLEEIFQFGKKCGYDGVELRLHEPHISVTMDQKQRNTVKEVAAKYEMDICCLAAYSRFSSEDEHVRQKNTEDLRSIVELAGDIGCPYVRSFGGDPKSSVPIDQVTTWIGDAFKAVEPTAEKYGVKTLLETHDILSKGLDAARIFDNHPLPQAGVVWDIKHSLVQGESLTETMTYLNGRIDHIHMKDWFDLYGGGEHLVLMGAGLMPTRQVLQQLRGIDYQGYLSLEWEKLWHPEIEDSAVAIQQYSWYMNRL